MSYRFRAGFRARAVKPDALGKELERVQKDEGALTASAVFEAAKPKGAVLHPEFEWDAKEAVRQLGLIRAREMIRAVFVLPEEDVTAQPVPVWAHVPDDGKANGPGEYQRIADLVERPDEYARALTELQRKFDSARDSLEELRRAAAKSQIPDRLASINLVAGAFSTVREALAILAQTKGQTTSDVVEQGVAG